MSDIKLEVIDGKVIETKEVISEYSKIDIDIEIENIEGEIDNFQNEIDRLNKTLAKWQDKKILLEEKEVLK